MFSYPSTLGAGAKTRLHTPKAVTYHEQSQIIHHGRSHSWASGILSKEVYAAFVLQARAQGQKEPSGMHRTPSFTHNIISLE